MTGRLFKPNCLHLCLSDVGLSSVAARMSLSLTLSPSVVARFVLTADSTELVSGLRFNSSALLILRCNTFHILSFQYEHTPFLAILMFLFADLPANSTRDQGSRGFIGQCFSLPQWGANCPFGSSRCHRLRAGAQLLLRVGVFNADERCLFY